eukprot:contig_14359_g3449
MRFLRLCVELVIMCTSPEVRKTYAKGLAETLRRSVRVQPSPYHGGIFIGKDCHTIMARRVVVVHTLLGVVPDADYRAVKMFWDLWDKVRRTLNRADTIDEEETKAFRSNTTALVTWLKNKFPWFNVSP